MRQIYIQNFGFSFLPVYLPKFCVQYPITVYFFSFFNLFFHHFKRILTSYSVF